MTRVFDEDFVENERYAEILVDTIPTSKITDTLIQIYRNRKSGDAKKVRYVSIEIIKRLSDSDLGKFLHVVSEELNVTNENSAIISSFQLIPDEYSPKINESARMRIENKLIKSISEGEVILFSDKLRSGGLGTWAADLIPYFSLTTELTRVLIRKLEDEDLEDPLYVFKYFIYDLPILFKKKNSINKIVDAMHRIVLGGCQSMNDLLYEFLTRCSPEWKDEILEKFKELTNTKEPEFWLPNGIPFLGNLPEVPSTDVDIPF